MITIDLQDTKIPALGFGTYKLKGPEAEVAIIKALETGYRHIDTAQIYDNEKEVGNAILASGVQREDIFLTTKIWMDKVRDGDLQASADASLKKLKTEYVDLLLIHWPVKDVPFSEQLKALQEVQASGKAKMIGVSNFNIPMVREVVETIGAPVVTNQVEYHPFLLQKPMLDYLKAHRMFLTAYSPLAQGHVTGNPKIEEIAKKYSKTAGQITLRWLVQQPNVAAIPKSGTEQRIRENFDIFDFTLTDDDMRQIHALAHAGGRVVNPAFAPDWDQAA